MVPDAQNYQSLALQVAERIAREIRQETWVERLPGERTLAESLNVSRKTLRKALAVLHHDGVIRTTHGLGHEIVEAPAAVPHERQALSIGLVAPESIEYLRPFSALWIDALRSLLIEHGARLSTFAGPRFFTGNPAKALTQLVNRTPQHCWLLAHSNERIQQWFYDEQVPCVVAGSCHPGLDLANVDLDYFAVCRHAVGVMLRHGHRHIAFLTPTSQRAGDLESEAGFSAGVRQPSYGEITPLILRHDGTVPGINRMLHRMFDYGTPPTAVLVANPSYYLTAASFLAERGLRIPQDVSLVSRDNDVFLPFLNPQPARYSCNPKTFAKRLLQPLLAQGRGEPHDARSIRIDVKFERGGSLGAAAGHSG